MSLSTYFCFFFNDTATTEIYTLSLHDALPISQSQSEDSVTIGGYTPIEKVYGYEPIPKELNAEQAKYILGAQANVRSEEHTSELQSRQYLVCRLLLEKKKKQKDSQFRSDQENS